MIKPTSFKWGGFFYYVGVHSFWATVIFMINDIMKYLSEEDTRITLTYRKDNTELIRTIEREKLEPFYSFYLKYSPEWLLEAFNGRTDKSDVKKWDVIPAEQYRRALERFMEEPTSFRLPESVVNGWMDIIMKNTCQFISLNKLYGRTECYEANVRELRGAGFYRWASEAWSDLGAMKIYEILREYREDMSAGEKLVLINRCINVVHIRGSISRFFIEGGEEACDKISGGR